MKKSTKIIKSVLDVFGGDDAKYLTITKDTEFLKEMKTGGIPGRWRNQKPVDHDPNLKDCDVLLIIK